MKITIEFANDISTREFEHHLARLHCFMMLDENKCLIKDLKVN